MRRKKSLPDKEKVERRQEDITERKWRLHNCGNTTEATTLLQQFIRKKKNPLHIPKTPLVFVFPQDRYYPHLLFPLPSLRKKFNDLLLIFFCTSQNPSHAPLPSPPTPSPPSPPPPFPPFPFLSPVQKRIPPFPPSFNQALYISTMFPITLSLSLQTYTDISTPRVDIPWLVCLLAQQEGL